MTTPTIVTNAGTGNAYATNELRIDMAAKRYTADAKLTALTTILLRLSKDKAHNFRVDLTEENQIPVTATVATTRSAGGATLVVQNYGTTIVQDSILWNEQNGEYLRVTANPTSNSLTVTNYSGTASDWNVGDTVFILPPTLAENDTLDWNTFRTSSVVDTNVYNFIQVMKLQFSINRVADKMHTQFGGVGSKRLQLQSQKLREFKVKDELRKWLGVRSSGGTAPASRYSTGGIKNILENGTLYKDFGGIFTESGFDNWIGAYHDQNPDAKKVAFFGAGNVIRQINYFAKDKIRISPNSKSYGLNLNRYIGGDIELDLIPVPVFAYGQKTKGWGFILDLERIMLKEIDPLVLTKEALNEGQSEKIIDTYRAVDSMLVANESRHSMMVGADL